jgi:alanine dehydrogenase
MVPSGKYAIVCGEEGIVSNPVLLNERDVRAVLPMPDLITAMEGALAQFSAGAVTQPVRTVLEVGADKAFFGVMPASLDDPPAVGAKLVTVYGKNHDRGLPSHLATIVLLDHATGALVAVLDGRYITEARTAAVSAVSVKHLARADARVLGIIGSGVQARSHLEAIRHVRALEEVRVWSPNALHREAFAFETSDTTGLPVKSVAAASLAARGADIVVLATSATSPVIEDTDVDPGTHIAGVGACRPDQREMPTTLLARARVYVDSRAAARQEAGDLLIPQKEGAFDDGHIVGELGALVGGRVPGRLGRSDVTIFKSLGLAVEDVVTARLVADRAAAAGLGQPLKL